MSCLGFNSVLVGEEVGEGALNRTMQFRQRNGLRCVTMLVSLNLTNMSGSNKKYNVGQKTI